MANLKSWSEKARPFCAPRGELIKHHLCGGEGASIFDGFGQVLERETRERESEGLQRFVPLLTPAYLGFRFLLLFFFLEVLERESEGF